MGPSLAVSQEKITVEKHFNKIIISQMGWFFKRNLKTFCPYLTTKRFLISTGQKVVFCHNISL
jgi:hypothetical protein